MVVSVQFHGVHRATTRTKEVDVSLPPDARVDDLMRRLERTYPGLNLSQNDFVLSINDHIPFEDQPLNDADKVAFLPHIGGG